VKIDELYRSAKTQNCKFLRVAICGLFCADNLPHKIAILESAFIGAFLCR